MSGFFLTMAFLLLAHTAFPDPQLADEDGLLAIGGDLHPQRVKQAYLAGIFPWFNPGDPCLWYSPPMRMVLFFNELHISRSMRRVLKSGGFTVTFDKAFDEVMAHCKTVKRKGHSGSWITAEMQQSYSVLHREGFAKSVEVWQNGALVGGLFGMDLGHVFCGDSMFSLVPNASKVAFISLAALLQQKGYAFLDCQIYNDHLASLGAREIPRNEFLLALHP